MHFVIMSSKVSREGLSKGQCFMRGPYGTRSLAIIAAIEWRSEQLRDDEFDFLITPPLDCEYVLL